MEKISVKEYAKRNGVCHATVYSRMKEIFKKEGKFRLPTAEELKPKKSGRPIKYEI